MAGELGDLVQDRISGQQGIVLGVTTWLYGCRRLTIQPRETKDGKPAESFCVDEPQCVVVDAGVIPGVPITVRAGKRPSGPRENAGRRPDADRGGRVYGRR